MDELRLVRALFAALDNEAVAYLHWKSNEHLPAALRGETDLDLLVDSGDRAVFEAVLRKLGFISMLPPKARAIPGLEGHLGFDQATGALVHLDVHFRLVLGEQLVKNHHLPLEGWLLSHPAELEGVPVPQPEHEFLLLYIRSMLKTTNRQLLRSLVKGGSPLPERIQKEVAWLGERADRARLAEAAESSPLDIGGDELLEFYDRSTAGRVDGRYARDRKRSLRKRLRKYERLPRYRAVPKRISLRFRSKTWMRRLGLGIPSRRLAGIAPLIAAIGADGSGKTRLSKDLETWLGWKLATRHLYFGQPKRGVVFKAFNKPGSIARHRNPKVYPPPGGFGLVVRIADNAKWLVLAARRNRLAQEAMKSCHSGEVVIAERYPLHDFYEMPAPMDGPRLQSKPGVLSRLELRQYESIPEPDLLLILATDIQTLRSRKVDLTVEEHLAKVEAVASLADGPDRIVIDAGRPYEQVLLDAKTAIWRALLEGR